jgi:hydrogenase maturation factor
VTDGPVCITCGDVAIPMRVVDIGGEDGLAHCVGADGEAAAVDVALVEGVSAGDAVLVHARVALSKLDGGAV